MNDSNLHRVRRLRWQARASNAPDAFALQRLLHRRSEEVSAALEQACASFGLGADEVWQLPSLTLRLEACSLAHMDADLPAQVADALRQALQRALPIGNTCRADGRSAVEASADQAQLSTLASAAESAHAALRHYLATGSLPWALAGLSAEAQQLTLQGAALAALHALLTPQDYAAALAEVLGATAPLPARLGALLRWLPLFSPAQRQRWLFLSPHPAGLDPALTEAWFARLASPSVALEWLALWLVWPTLQGLHGLATAGATETGASASPDALALARWIAGLPADIAALRLTSSSAPVDQLAAALLRVLGSAPASSGPTPSATARPIGAAQHFTVPVPAAKAATTDASLVPLAGLVLLHPYLPRLLKGCGLVDDTGRLIDDAALPRACSLLHALACGDPTTATTATTAAEHQLPLIKLLLGRAPDEALTAALPRPSAAEREEIDGLLAAVRNHWKALENTSAEGLRLSFLQRRGLLRRAEGAWQLHLQAEAFDVLLDLLPWSISLVKLPWMPLPLMVEWHAP